MSTHVSAPGQSPNAPLRVVYLTSYLPPYRVSFLETVQEELPGLVTLISTPMERNRQWKPDWGTLDVRLQHSLSFFHTWHQPGRFSERWQRHVPWDTLPRLARLAPDIIISHEMGARSTFSALYRMLRRRSRLILWQTISEHTERHRPRYLLPLRRALLKRSDAIIANGRSCARYLASLGTEAGKISIIPYAVDTTLFAPAAPRQPDPSHRRLLYVGRVTQLKGLEPFLARLSCHARTHPQTGFTLVVVGGGDTAPLSCLDLPDNLLLEPREHVTYTELPALYRAADLTIFPSLADEWGMAVAESLACGTPVLGSLYSQAVEELVAHGHNGWTYYTDNFDTLDKAIEDCFLTPCEEWSAIRGRCREAGLQLANATLARRLVELVRATATGRR